MTAHHRENDWYCACAVKDCPDLLAIEVAAESNARQDIADGAALRRLREALPDFEWALDYAPGRSPQFGMMVWHDVSTEVDALKNTIAEAADACRAEAADREALR